ncbi:general substrate transporter [Microdochium bolleyi]|uniref:General substrate transporter n=1 Tax=Microdochium bolleyi TaxID=196109 RepID=A0A136IUX8_9PEZI|nr:general substrate transporter [Microdochium bolleyi]
MNKNYNILVIFVAALGSFSYGFSLAVIGSVLGVPSFLSYFGLVSGANAESLLGATSALFAAGCAFGALFESQAADRYGRIRTLQACCAIAAISSAIQGGSVHVAMFLVGRFFNGIGVGALLALVPVYMVEISPAETRGLLVGSHGFLVVTGHAFAAWTGFGCYFSSNEAFQWRFELSAQAIAPVMLLVATHWIPESPRWLLEQNRAPEAFKILTELHGDSTDTQHAVTAREEFYQVSQQILLDKKFTEKEGKWALFTKPSYRKRVLCAMATMFLSQSTGVLVINNYQVMLYNGLGLFDSLPLLLYAIYLTWAAILNYFSARIMDRVGRTRLLIIGFIACPITIIFEMSMVAAFSGTTNKVGNAFGVLFLFLYVGFYASCIDATIYVYSAEIFPTHVRATGMGLAIFAQSCTTLLYTQTAPTAFSTIGWKYYFVFVLVPLLSVPVVWKYWPETKGATLEEIGQSFGDDLAVDITHLDEEDRARLQAQVQDLTASVTVVEGYPGSHETKSEFGGATKA